MEARDLPVSLGDCLVEARDLSVSLGDRLIEARDLHIALSHRVIQAHDPSIALYDHLAERLQPIRQVRRWICTVDGDLEDAAAQVRQRQIGCDGHVIQWPRKPRLLVDLGEASEGEIACVPGNHQRTVDDSLGQNTDVSEEAPEQVDPAPR